MSPFWNHAFVYTCFGVLMALVVIQSSRMCVLGTIGIGTLVAVIGVIVTVFVSFVVLDYRAHYMLLGDVGYAIMWATTLAIWGILFWIFNKRIIQYIRYGPIIHRG